MDLHEWRDDWSAARAGHGCVLCRSIGADETEFGLRVFTGDYLDAYLGKRGIIPGYTVAVFNRGHVCEPTELDPGAAAGYWRELLRVGRGVEASIVHVKMNYLMLGNGVPHLHTHVIPRPPRDPAPHAPLPWQYLDEGEQDPVAVAEVANRLAAAIDGAG